MLRGLLVSAVLVMGLGAHASELDRDMSNVQNPELNGTIVMKVNNNTGSVEVLKVDSKVVSSKEEAVALSKSKKFVPVPKNKLKNELDTEAGSSSWYFYNYSYNPYYCYNNYTYPYYYRYNYSYYSYYYYGSYYRWW